MSRQLRILTFPRLYIYKVHNISVLMEIISAILVLRITARIPINQLSRRVPRGEKAKSPSYTPVRNKYVYIRCTIAAYINEQLKRAVAAHDAYMRLSQYIELQSKLLDNKRTRSCNRRDFVLYLHNFLRFAEAHSTVRTAWGRITCRTARADTELCNKPPSRAPTRGSATWRLRRWV